MGKDGLRDVYAIRPNTAPHLCCFAIAETHGADEIKVNAEMNSAT
jgi:hypothetical protein|tara:strand:- start:6109 stop:6243 length:135 start_codon:yes stop_codon:yes gene_type:complete